jgi:hypothetical protein
MNVFEGYFCKESTNVDIIFSQTIFGQMIATGETKKPGGVALVGVLPNLWQGNRVASGVTKGKRRAQCVLGSYQNYQHVAVSHQLTDGGRGGRVCRG